MEKEFNKNDEIDINNIVSIVLRNKKLILSTSLVFFILGIFISLFSPKKWEGNFQIVLRFELDEKSLINNSTLNTFLPLSLNRGVSDVNTEVGILESPAVLMPIFKYVLNEKSTSKNNYNLSFRDWKSNNLQVSLKDQTSILDINYKDQEKDIILPVLAKISEAYEEYADKKTKKSNSYKIDFLNQQISKFKLKSKASLKKVQEFAIDQDLVLVNDYNLRNASKNSENLEVASNADLELVRIRANDNIKKFDLQIKNIESLDLNADSSIIAFLGIIDDDFSLNNLKTSLDNIDEKIILYRSKYTNNDPAIQRLKEERKETLKILKSRTLGILKAKSLIAKSIKESATRPKDVLLEYKNLLRDSYRDERTLLELENKLRIISLANAKKKEPFELITEPTLLDKPIGLRKSQAGLMGIFFGLIVGFIYSFIKEKNSKMVIVMEDIKKYINVKIIKKLDSDINFEKSNLSTFIIDQYSLDSTPVTILLNENISENLSNQIIISCEKLEKNYKIKINIKTLEDIFKKDNKLIFITSLNQLKFSKIEEISERFSILNIKISAIFCCN